MVDRIVNKIIDLNRARFRKSQMLEIVHLRPYWQKRGSCDDPGDPAGYQKRQTFTADDPFWDSRNAPWNCTAEDCDCCVNSLTRTEFERYVQDGCSPGDEAAAKLPIL
jgi:hypothetical protein